MLATPMANEQSAPFRGASKTEQAASALRRRLGRHVDGLSLAVFRLVFGCLIAFELGVALYTERHRELGEPVFHFAQPLLREWFHLEFAWPKAWAAPLVGVGIGLALLLAAGLFYRLSALLLAIWYWVYLLSEHTLYINHSYLYCLLLSWLVFMPGHNSLSIDRQWRRSWFRPKFPDLTREWTLWLLRGQMFLVYFFGGIAKLNEDWLAGAPLSIWLPRKAQISPLGEALLWQPLPVVMAYAGMLFDLLVGPLLLWKRTRMFAFVCALAFHFSNAAIFGIASFPWMSIAITSLFFEPDWPRRVAVKFRQFFARYPVGRWPGFAGATTLASGSPPSRPVSRLLLGTLVLYAVVQLALPLRRHLYPGDTSWTEEGHQFAWRMMLRTKVGKATFVVREPSGVQHEVNPRQHLTPRQINRMATHPELLRQYARFLADDWELKNGVRPQVFVASLVRLNGHRARPLVAPSVELGSLSWSLRPATWIEPFEAGR